MQPRSDLIQQFSTFLSFERPQAQLWIHDPKLRRSMEKARASQKQEGLEQHTSSEQTSSEQSKIESLEPNSAEESQEDSGLLWSLYWHRRWQATVTPTAQGLPTAHLTSYLQEACFWAAYKISSKMQQRGRLPDLFQEAIARTPKILKGFNPDVSRSLQRYGEFSFSNLIRDHLRQTREMDACTSWSLLHRVSRRRITEALNQAGIIGALQQQYLLAWDCYCEFYVPAKNGARKLEKPSSEVWAKIAAAYVQAQGPQAKTQTKTPSPEVLKPQELETWLVNAVRAIRAYQTPNAVSLDAPLGSGEEAGSFYDVLPSDQDLLMEQWIEAEEREDRRGQYQDLGVLLKGTIDKLKPEEQALLRAYYGEQLRQQEIAEKLGLKQYSISRKLSRARQKLLKALVSWSETMMHKALDPSVLDSMGSSLEDWLVQHYQSSAS